MKVIILAGGYGTRLYPLTLRTPKPILPVAGKPVLTHLIEQLVAGGLTDIVVSLNEAQHKMKDCLGDGLGLGAKISYVFEPGLGDEHKLGSVGAMQYVLSKIGIPKDCLVVGGDNYVHGLDFAEMRKFHAEKKPHATLVLYKLEKKEDAEKFGIAAVDAHGNITGFQEKPKAGEAKSMLASTAIYHFSGGFLEKELEQYFTHKKSKGEKPDKLGELFEHFIGKCRLYGYTFEGMWGDIGSADSYVETNREAMKLLMKGKTNSIAKTANIHSSAKIVAPCIIEDGCVVGKDAVVGPYTHLMHGTHVGEGAKAVDSIVFENVRIEKNAEVHSCAIDGNAAIGENARVGANAVIGYTAKVGKGATVAADTKLYPFFEVKAGQQVHGKNETQEKVYAEKLMDSRYWK